MRTAILLLAAAGAAVWGPLARGAAVSWSEPEDVLDAGDLLREGTLVFAANATADDEVRVVETGEESIVFEPVDFGVSATSTGTYFTGGGGDTGNEGLNAVFNSHAYSGSAWSFTVGGLTPGQSYRIQLFGGGDTRGCCSERNQRAGDGESPENVSGDFSRSGVGSVTGAFTATGTEQTIRVLPGSVNGTDPAISGYLLRAVSPPEPRPPTDIRLSTLTVPAGAPAGAPIAVLSAIDPDAGDTHTFSLTGTAAFPDNLRFAVQGTELRLAEPAGEPGTVYSIRLLATDSDGLTFETSVTLTVREVPPQSGPRINEFLADNSSGSLRDEDGDSEDWIEIYNPDPLPLDLTGWYLSDDRENPRRWKFPAATVPPGGYLVIFASGKDRRPPGGEPALHTNFSLSADGEFLSLSDPDGTIRSSIPAGDGDYPAQRANIAYGLHGDPPVAAYLLTPTPGAANDTSEAVEGFAEAPEFSVDHGLYDAGFALRIESPTPGAAVYFTTDGSWPQAGQGTLYTGPISIDRTKVVKAAAFREGYLSSDVVCRTYLFPGDIVNQTAESVQAEYGFPSTWNGTSPDYGMNGNSEVVPPTDPALRESLLAIPSLSVAMDSGDLFGSSGIYSRPSGSGAAWERRTSLEWIDPAGAPGFQIHCAIRIQGGAFRDFGLTRKKSFRVLFKRQYGTANLPTGGPGKLEFPVFGAGGVQEFDTLVFRMESNDGWQWAAAGGNAQFARDEFGRRMQLALGQPAPRGTYCHLYLNGVYWGIYNVVERPDAGFAASALGADRELWQGQNSGSPINDATGLGDWNAMLSVVDDISQASGDAARDAEYLEACGFRSDGTRNRALPVWIDANNFIDYLLVNWYGGNGDWPFKNYYCGRAREPDSAGFRFFMWDSEWSLFLQSDTDTNRTGDFRGVAAPQAYLAQSPEYRMRFADRTFRATANGGPMAPEPAEALYRTITEQHAAFLPAESARWGNQHGQKRGVAHWSAARERILNDWFPVRTAVLMNQLRSRGLYPSIDPPKFSQQGGNVDAGGTISMSVPSTVSRIYYLFGAHDPGSTTYDHPLDPRLPGGGIRPGAVEVDTGGGGIPVTRLITGGDEWRYLDDGSNAGTSWRQSGFSDGGWHSGPSPLGYGDGDEATVVGSVDADPGQSGVQRNATTYFRRTVNIPDPSVFASYLLHCVYDDAVAVYVNGTEVFRSDNLPANATYNTYAPPAGEAESAEVTLSPARFAAGNNVIAAEVHQSSPDSSDVRFDLSLTGYPPGGPTFTSAPIPVSGHGWLLARSRNEATGEWSALNSAFFSVDAVPATARDLAVSEIHYHPAPPPEGAPSADAEDYEFVELLNTGTKALDLGGVAFTEGIRFAFAPHSILNPGARVVIVGNREAFDARYGGRPDAIAFGWNSDGAGEFEGNLDNGGETLVLRNAAGDILLRLEYDDRFPRPEDADGAGYSLVLRNPESPPGEFSDPGAWTAGNRMHGTPGTGETGFAGDAGEDLDGDGFPALVEFALGTSDRDPAQGPDALVVGTAVFATGGSEAEFLTVSLRIDASVSEFVDIRPESSDDLMQWDSPAMVLVSETEGDDGRTTVAWRSAEPTNGNPVRFVRLRAVALP